MAATEKPEKKPVYEAYRAPAIPGWLAPGPNAWPLKVRKVG